ncbi:MAG: hypothetical protein PHV75_05915 [Victivallaceae bacterium]|nr:hypothetical protein [Victivallaceae bacterium]
MISEPTIYKIALLGTGLLCFLIAVGHFKIRQEYIGHLEQKLRNRNLGFLPALLALLWCIPHARPIVWDWMLPWLLPAAVIFSIAAYFYLENLLPRAIGGIFILYGCYIAQESFTRHTPGSSWLVGLTWVIAVGGMFIAAKPHLVRDYLRKVVADERYRFIGSCFWFVYGLWSVVAGLLEFANHAAS